MSCLPVGNGNFYKFSPKPHVQTVLWNTLIISTCSVSCMVDGIYCKGEISCWLEKKKNQDINFCSLPFSYFQLVLWLESWSVHSGNKSMLIYDIRVFLVLFQVPNQKDLLLLCVLLPLKYIFFLSWTVTGQLRVRQNVPAYFQGCVCVCILPLHFNS